LLQVANAVVAIAVAIHQSKSVIVGIWAVVLVRGVLDIMGAVVTGLQNEAGVVVSRFLLHGNVFSVLFQEIFHGQDFAAAFHDCALGLSFKGVDVCFVVVDVLVRVVLYTLSRARGRVLGLHIVGLWWLLQLLASDGAKLDRATSVGFEEDCQE